MTRSKQDMNRRDAIKLGAAGLVGATLTHAKVGAAAPAPGEVGPRGPDAHPRSSPGVGMKRNPDVVVVGAGVFGVWTALLLARQGVSEDLLDAYGPGNSRSSSGGETRLMRAAYGDRNIYTRMAIESYAQWEELQERSSEAILLQTGRLVLETDENERTAAVEYRRTMESFGIRTTEILDASEVGYRWPQIRSDDVALATYDEGGAAGSTLMSRRSCRAVAREVEAAGGRVRIAHARPGNSGVGRLEELVLSDGETRSAAAFVFACGPWLLSLFPELLGDRLRVERRDVFFHGVPAGDDRFGPERLPAWSVRSTNWYGIPDVDYRGLKAAPYPDLNSIDPDMDQRLVTPQQIKRAHDFVWDRFPALAGHPVTETRVCQVTNTPDGHLLVDRHPALENVWIAGGGSGHGFKHGPAIGELAAGLVMGSDVDPEYAETLGL